MKIRSLLLPLLLISCHSALSDSVLQGQGGLINLTGKPISINPSMKIDSVGSMQYTDANMPWVGIGPDGKKRNISTIAYSFNGTITGTFTSPLPNCNHQAVWIGWTVMRPGLGSIINPDSSALYGNGLTPGAAVQTLYRVTGQLADYQYEFRHQNVVGYIYVSDGPAGIYSGLESGIPQAGSMSSVYVFSSGNTPEAITYMDTYGDSCGVHMGGVGTPPIPSPPIINPTPDTTCNFSLSKDTLDLGNVDSSSAISAKSSVNIIAQCNGDSSVNLKSSPSEMDMGGLTIKLSFDNGNSEKTNWKIRTDIVDTTPFTASVSTVGTLVPGSYERSGIINIIYD